MVQAYPEDGIIVVDAGADQISGFWGELATTVCQKNGVRGSGHQRRGQGYGHHQDDGVSYLL